MDHPVVAADSAVELARADLGYRAVAEADPVSAEVRVQAGAGPGRVEDRDRAVVRSLVAAEDLAAEALLTFGAPVRALEAVAVPVPEAVLDLE